MDIINRLPEGKFAAVDDLLAFVSIYDDEIRTQAYFNLLEGFKPVIKDRVCVELGAGLGFMSEKLAQLGAKKVYAVEKNPYLFEMAQERLERYPQVEVINSDIADFVPDEEVSVAVYEFFGQMLFDEDLYVLEKLKWKPNLFLPDGAVLRAGVTNIENFEDEIVNRSFLAYLDGVLVSGLFDEEDVPLQFDVMKFSVYKPMPREIVLDISGYKGNLLYFGLELTHQGETFCQAGLCSNWSYVWTLKKGNVFRLAFEETDRGTEVIFEWVD